MSQIYQGTATATTAGSFVTDSGSATPNGSGIINDLGGVGTNTSGSGNTVVTNLNTPYMQQGLNCWFWNLGITHAAGTLTIAGADGTALSATNPAYLCMPSNATAGQMASFTLTANVTLTVSDLTGNVGNMTASTAYTNSFPLYIGFMADSSDANLVGCLTWQPHQTLSCTTGTDIGDPDLANADKQFSCFAFSSITEADYTGKNIGLIGSVTATKDASDIYTLDALDATYDGVGKFQWGRFFTYSAGNFGSGTSSLIKDNGGTAPTFTTRSVTYTFKPGGEIKVNWYLNADAGTDGSGAVTAFFALPYAVSATLYPSRLSGESGWGNSSVTGAVDVMNTIFPGDDPAGVIGIYSGGSNFTNASFGNGARRWVGGISYTPDNDYN